MTIKIIKVQLKMMGMYDSLVLPPTHTKRILGAPLVRVAVGLKIKYCNNSYIWKAFDNIIDHILSIMLSHFNGGNKHFK